MKNYRTNSITNLGPKIWELLPQNTKEAISLSSFENKVKKWIPKNCTRFLSKKCIAQVGFIKFFT